MEAVKATYQIFYNSKNITNDITPFCIGLSYTDKTENASDEIEINLENKDGRWLNEWYPTKNDLISAKIIVGDSLLDCGSFRIDQPTFNFGTGNTFSLKGIAAGINVKLRTKNNFAHESKSLRQIINQIASKHSLKVVGEVKDIQFDRVSQHEKTDLHFLRDLAYKYGYLMSVKSDKLVFVDMMQVEKSKAIATMQLTDFISLNISDKLDGTYKNSKHVHFHTRSKKVVDFTTKEDKYDTGVDDLNHYSRVENKSQAQRQTEVKLYKANSQQVTGSFSTEGNVLLMAGVNIELPNIGKLSGIYHITSSTHTVSPDGGYSVSGEFKRTKA